MFQRKIVPWLLGAAVVLVLVNILVDKYYKPHFIPQEKQTNLADEEIKKRFKKSIFNFGLDKDYIKASSKKNSNKFIISLPADLPIPLILNELSDNFQNTNVEVKSIEKKINGYTIVELTSGEEKKVIGEFGYEKNAKRKIGFIGLLIKDMQLLNQEDNSLLLNSSESFAVLLVPSEASKKFSQKIIESKKEYAVLLNDDISELEYKLSESYSGSRLKTSIRNIVGSYSKAVFFIADDNSSLYRSSVYPLVEKEITKRGIKLLKLSEISKFKAAKEERGIELKQLISHLEQNDYKLFLTSAENFVSLWPEISSFRKVGYKFINPSLIVSAKIN